MFRIQSQYSTHLYVSLLVRLPFADASARQPHILPSRTSQAASTRPAVAADASANDGRSPSGISGRNTRSGNAVNITADK